MYAKKKSVSMKAVALLLVVILLIGCTIGGTIAYLMTNTTPVVNTFVAGEIGELTLTEDKGQNTTGITNIKVIPGVDITKDPKVSFSGHNVDAYVFLKVEADGWNVNSDADYFSQYFLDSEGYLEWYLAEGWEYYGEVERAQIYCRKVSANEKLDNVSVIKDDKITVSSKITKEDLKDYTLPDLTFTAYAIQASGYDAALKEEYELRNAAWAALNPPANDDEG